MGGFSGITVRAACAAVVLWAISVAGQTPTPVIVTVGSLPRAVAVDPNTNTALVANFGESSVSIIDLAREQVTATVSVASPAGLAINPTNGLAVISNSANNSVTVFHIPTRQVRAVIPVGSVPIGVAINTVSNVAVVVNSQGSSVSLVDLNTLRVTSTVDGIPNATGVQSVAVDSSANVAAVASSTSNSLFILDLATARIRTQIPVQSSPSGVAIEAVSRTAIVTNLNSNSASLVDLATNTVRATVTSLTQPQAVATSSRTRSALVTTANNTLEVIDLNSGEVATSFADLPGALGVAYNDNTGRAVVALPPNGSLAIVRSLGLFTVLNGAGFQFGAVAPSSVVSGFGFALSTETGFADSLPLPTTLKNVIVRVGNIQAPLFYVSPGQINFQVPRMSQGNYRVDVLASGRRVATGFLGVAATAPALFTVNSQGTGQAAARNEDNFPNGVTDPFFTEVKAAPRGSIIQMFGTGGGSYNPDPLPGTAPSGAAPTILRPTAQIGGLNAEVVYSGASPCCAGLWQLNLRIPATVRVGSSVPVVVTQGGKTSNTVTIVVE